MPLFQKSVLHSIKQDESLVALRWAAYQNYLAKIDFIKSVKEEKFQDGFLKDVFENCLGYTLDSTNPSAFNLEREKKNETDGKKADGVIVIDGEIVGIVELKDQKTKNLDVVEAQAFNYHNSHSNSKYIIISNFDELRFYIDKKTAYEKFSLFNLTYEEFKTLHLLLSFESIRDNVPLKLKEKSSTFEQTISKELYRDFSAFRTHLFENIIKNNYTLRPELVEGSHRDKQTLLRLTQKLCDRIIFILFAEDRGLLRANTIKEIREEFKNQKFTHYALYDIYKFYFNAINEGNDKLGIPKYNGGLFATDELLDSLIIDDEYLDMKAQKLSDFDFVSEISVNILGHIFEQSLTDLEEMNASINDTEFDKKKSKRKKDGVFYTPEYITRYIVENTLGKLCFDKKASLGLTDIEEPQNPKKLTKAEQETLKKLYEYRDFLLNLKILDPACGSGAFLNQALEFLIREHQNLDETRRAYENELLSLYDIEANILEHNLYGVDINEDAVEIARLSLWLRTAQKGRALTNLSDKIKCGNSLIADKSVAENAFVWEEEFPEVFVHGGFDVVIGNPPYIMEDDNRSAFIGLHNKPCYQGKTDIWHLFTCQGIALAKEKGLISFIAKNQWLQSASASNMRKNMYAYTHIDKIIDFGINMIFENVGQQTMIFILTKTSQNHEHKINFIKFKNKFSSNEISEIIFDDLVKSGIENSTKIIPKFYDEKENLTFSSDIKELLLTKIELKKNFEFDEKREIIQGIIGGPDKAFIVGKDDIDGFSEKEKKCLKMFHTNTDRYTTPPTSQYIFYISKKNFDVQMLEDSPNIKKQLDKYRDQLLNRREVLKGSIEWFHLWWAREENYFIQGDKIIFASRTKGKEFTFTADTFYGSRNLFFVKSDRVNLKYITAFLNSQLMYFYMQERLKHTGDLLQIDKNQFMKIPLYVSEKVDDFIFNVDAIIRDKENIQKYIKHLPNLNAVEKIEIKEEIEKLENQIIQAEKQIDAMVYALYGLSEDEIAIVEGK